MAIRYRSRSRVLESMERRYDTKQYSTIMLAIFAIQQHYQGWIYCKPGPVQLNEKENERTNRRIFAPFYGENLLSAFQNVFSMW